MSIAEGPSNQRNDKATWDRLLLRATTDPSFRERLLTNPTEVLLSYGIEIPENANITVHDFDPNHQHIFLPPLGAPIAKPAITRSDQDATERFKSSKHTKSWENPT